MRLHRPARWSRPLAVIGLLALFLGVLDPLEGSIVILVGAAVVVVAALLRHSHHGRLVSVAFFLVLTGVAALWSLSALGGIGGQTGRSLRWGLLFLPYPLGWILGMVGAIRLIREASTTAVQPAP
jgi:hypothetical protein